MYFTGFKMTRFRVVVIGHEDGFLNSYFAGRVIRNGKHKLLINEKLVEQVKIKHIRPYPPKINHKVNEGDDVDAYDGAGWWRGKVILERRHDVVVYFKYMTNKNDRHYLYEREHVRIHAECTDIGGANETVDFLASTILLHMLVASCWVV